MVRSFTFTSMIVYLAPDIDSERRALVFYLSDDASVFVICNNVSMMIVEFDGLFFKTCLFATGGQYVTLVVIYNKERHQFNKKVRTLNHIMAIIGQKEYERKEFQNRLLLPPS